MAPHGLGVGIGGRRNAHLHVLGKVYVVVAVYAEDFLYNVALAGDVYHIGRGEHGCLFSVAGLEVVAHGLKYGDHILCGDVFAHEAADAVEVKFYPGTLRKVCANLLDIAADMAAGALDDEVCRSLEGVQGDLRICSALESERGIGLKALFL